MKPLTSYYGGKQRIASKVLSYFPKHTVYVEPFAGGAALLFAKPKPVVSNSNHYREVLNDKNDLLINLYRVAIEHRKELELKIQATLYSQSDHRKAIEITKNPDGYDELTKAWAFYVNINQSFSKTLNRGWATSVSSDNHPVTWHNKKLRLPEILDRIKDIYVSCEDAIKCIQRWDSPQTLFYCDPPYPNAQQGHYSGYTLDDLKLLCDILDNIQGSYVLSNYPQETEPQSAQQRVEIEAVMSAKGKAGHDRSQDPVKRENNKRTEVLWVCDRSHVIRNDLKSVVAPKSPIQQLALF
ncbi:MAG: DNA adenine methylase [Dolichospermum sp.]